MKLPRWLVVSILSVTAILAIALTIGASCWVFENVCLACSGGDPVLTQCPNCKRRLADLGIETKWLCPSCHKEFSLAELNDFYHRGFFCVD